ncbi:unnamed protein product, partial [Scytosiphon promiscuus]
SVYYQCSCAPASTERVEGGWKDGLRALPRVEDPLSLAGRTARPAIRTGCRRKEKRVSTDLTHASGQGEKLPGCSAPGPAPPPPPRPPQAGAPFLSGPRNPQQPPRPAGHSASDRPAGQPPPPQRPLPLSGALRRRPLPPQRRRRPRQRLHPSAVSEPR